MWVVVAVLVLQGEVLPRLQLWMGAQQKLCCQLLDWSNMHTKSSVLQFAIMYCAAVIPGQSRVSQYGSFCHLFYPVEDDSLVKSSGNYALYQFSYESYVTWFKASKYRVEC